MPESTHISTADVRPIVAVAGASGFVGSALRTALGDAFNWLALTSSKTLSQSHPQAAGTEWRHCDLFSLPQVTEALQGADCGVYLIHSMLPSSRMVQGNFADMDILLADNFARAARAAGLKHIIYLGGLIPANHRHLSPHLASRLEVESVLRQSSLPVTVLRAGLIVGPGGSSTRMLLKLVHRLPLMILPKWTRFTTQSTDVADVVRAIDTVIHDPELHGKTYDLGGHTAMSYRDMILATAAVMQKKPRYLYYPFNSIRLSRLWVRLISGVPAQLVNPLLESLTHNLKARPNPLMKRLQSQAIPFHKSIQHCLGDDHQPLPIPQHGMRQVEHKRIRAEKRVRSIQRLPLPRGWDAQRVAEAYGQWLTRSFRGLLVVRAEPDGTLVFHVRLPSVDLLILAPTPYSQSGHLRRAYYITGGMLAQVVDPPGRLEFRLVPELNCLLAAIHGYAPRLPWRLYSLTQARVHLWVMRAFGRYLDHAHGSENTP